MVRVALRGIRSHLVRLILTVLAVVVSVAFMSGTQFLTATISASFDKVFADVYKDIDAVVRSSSEVDAGFGKLRAPIDESVVPTVRGVEGVDAAEGQVRGLVTILDKSGEPIGNANAGPPTFGLNWLTSPELNGWRIETGRAPTGPTETLLDSSTAKKAGYQVGDTVRIQLNKGARDFTVVGTGGFGATPDYAGTAAALFDTATAQQLLTQPGKFNWINVAGADGVSQDELTARIAKVLPADTQVISGQAFTEESQDVFRRFIGILGTALLVFGLVALFVGAFIIYNTFSIIVASRTRELALLRAIGAGRRQVLGSVLLEAFTVGAVASLLGLLGGYALAYGLAQLLASSGSGAQFEGITVTTGALVSSWIVGTTVTVVSGLFPAWRASRVPPVAAMRETSIEPKGQSKVRIGIGAALLVIGLVAGEQGLFGGGDNAALLTGLGAFTIILGVAVLGPLFAKPMSRAIGAPLRWFTGRLASSNAQRNPRRTSTTALALMIGVALVMVVAILTQSVKATLGDAIDTSVAADLVVDSRSFNPATGFAPTLASDIAAVPGVAETVGVEFGFTEIGGKPATVIGADLAALRRVLTFDVVEGDLERLGANQVAVSKTDADANGWAVGTPIVAKFLSGGMQVIDVGAVYDWTAGQGGQLIMSRDGFATRFPPEYQLDNQIYVKLQPGADAAAARAEITKLVKTQFPSAAVQDLTEFKQSQTGFLDFFLALVTALLLIAIVIAVFGIINTLLLSVYERTREIGLLRAVGMARRQVRSTVRWEAVIFSLQGTIVGAVLGIAFGWALVKAIGQDNDLVLAVPTGLVVVMFLAALVAGVLAAILPAWRASRLNVLDAITVE